MLQLGIAPLPPSGGHREPPSVHRHAVQLTRDPSLRSKGEWSSESKGTKARKIWPSGARSPTADRRERSRLPHDMAA
jgi:hypothetical protein